MKLQITLSEEDINRLINGETLHIKNNHAEIEITQSLMKDMTAPIIRRDKNIYSDAEIENIKRALSMMADTMKLGC